MHNLGKTFPQNSGKYCYNWKGGMKKSNGYIYILAKSHPNCGRWKYIKRSRLIMEKIIGRYLKSTEITHHINGVKTDDRPKNLMLFKNRKEHNKFHKKSLI